MKARHHIAVQMEEEQQQQKENGPIVKTADQLWKYSGKIEEDTADYALYLKSRKPKYLKSNNNQLINNLCTR